MKSLSVHQSAAVTYQATILNADGSVARACAPKKNLLLDNGLNGIAVRPWAASFSVCVLGTGTTPTRRDSGVITFTRTGNVVEASANFFDAGDSGRLLKFDSGEECYLTFVDGTHATSNIAGAVPASQGTIYYVNETGHQTETKRTQSYANDTGANGVAYNGTTGVFSMWRTFLFSAEAGPVTYREIGWSWDMNPGGNLLGRDLIAGGGDSLIAGQQYKVKVQLDVTLSPIVATAVPNNSVGYNSAGEIALESISVSGGYLPLAYIDTNGGSNGGAAYIDPHNPAGISLYNTELTLTPNSPVPVNPTSPMITTGLTNDPYVAGSFTRTCQGTFNLNEANTATVTGISIYSFFTHVRGFTIKFTTPFAKTSSQTLKIVVRKSWGRVLVN